MQCAKCGLDLPQGTSQCPQCGTNEFVDKAPRKRIKPVYWAVIALALIAIISIAFAAIMRTRGTITEAPPGYPPSGRLLSAPPGQPAEGNLTSAPPGVPAPATTPATAAKPKPPQEVVDYLNHVKRVEEHRQMLLKDTGQALMLSAAGSHADSLLKLIDMAGDPQSKEAVDPLADTKKELERQYKNWLSTLQYFDTKTAPNQCREFSGAYRQVLYNETRTIGEISTQMSKVNVMDPKDMQHLLVVMQKMKNDPTIQANIDRSADNADAKLTQLVSNYDMEKPFDVPRESKTSGNIMGF